MGAKLGPSLQLMVLTVQAARRQGLEPGYGIDGVLEALEAGRAVTKLTRLAALWAAGDHDELARFADEFVRSSTAAERTAMQQVIDRRNAGLAEAIDALPAKGGKVLAAVGFLHMTGSAALQRLLAD